MGKGNGHFRSGCASPAGLLDAATVGAQYADLARAVFCAAMARGDRRIFQRVIGDARAGDAALVLWAWGRWCAAA